MKQLSFASNKTLHYITDKHANEEAFLVCLQFLMNVKTKVIVQEIFLDSVQIQSKTIYKNIAKTILRILKKHNINIQNCCGQA